MRKRSAPRNYGPIAKINGYYENDICFRHNYHFKADFRMNISTFDLLVNQVYSKTANLDDYIDIVNFPLRKAMCIGLEYMAGNYRNNSKLSRQYGISYGRCVKIVDLFLKCCFIAFKRCTVAK